MPRLHEIGIDWRVLLFTHGVSMVAGVIFGLAPALRLSSAGSAAPPEGREPRIGRHQRRLGPRPEPSPPARRRRARAVGHAPHWRRAAHPQLRAPAAASRRASMPSNVLTLELTMTGRKYNDAEAVLQTYKQLWERLSALPGRDRGRWRHGSATQPDDGVGPDHGRRARRRRRARSSSTPTSASSAAITSRR